MKQNARLLLGIVQAGPLAAFVGQVDATPVFSQIITHWLLLKVGQARRDSTKRSTDDVAVFPLLTQLVERAVNSALDRVPADAGHERRADFVRPTSLQDRSGQFRIQSFQHELVDVVLVGLRPWQCNTVVLQNTAHDRRLVDVLMREPKGREFIDVGREPQLRIEHSLLDLSQSVEVDSDTTTTHLQEHRQQIGLQIEDPLESLLVDVLLLVGKNLQRQQCILFRIGSNVPGWQFPDIPLAMESVLLKCLIHQLLVLARKAPAFGNRL